MSATFINKSGLPININSWLKKCDGLEEYVINTVQANESIVIKSSVGEWIIDNLLYKEHADQWRASGVLPGNTIGKFREKPCYRGEYSWTFVENFDIVYEPETRTATFTRKTPI
jgi:hypothetical protein